jgi:hypothetical protein
MALELVPLQRSPRTCFAQRPLTRLRLYPAFPQAVQDVTGNGRFMVDFSGPVCRQANGVYLQHFRLGRESRRAFQQ